MVQLFITLGLMAGYFLCYGTVREPTRVSWRFPFALQAGISFALIVGALFYLPESPRWLYHRGHSSKAASAWIKLNVAPADQGSSVSDELRHQEELMDNIDLSLIGKIRHHYHKTALKFTKGYRPVVKKASCSCCVPHVNAATERD